MCMSVFESRRVFLFVASTAFRVSIFQVVASHNRSFVAPTSAKPTDMMVARITRNTLDHTEPVKCISRKVYHFRLWLSLQLPVFGARLHQN